MNTENHIPIVIGNSLPFRLIVRDSDVWEPTLEEINWRTYDYIKLCRMSMFIDIGISPFSLGLGFDGTLVLPATKEFIDKEKALANFNAALGKLLLGGIYSEAVQPENIGFGELFFDGYIKPRGGGTGLVYNFYQAIKHKHVGTVDTIKLLNPEQINVQDISEAYSKGEALFKKVNMLSPNVLLNGTSNFVKHQWAESLIFLWTSIEQIVNGIWEQEIIHKNKPKDVIVGRQDFLKDYRTWTTSAKIELLFQKRIIPSNVYGLINNARKYRNEFIHTGSSLTESKVMNALDGLFKLISLVNSDYKTTKSLDAVLKKILNNTLGNKAPKKKVYKKDEVTHWLSIPPLPGDPDWGDKEYEIIDELVLKPIRQ
jgi:hypothetical protein